MGHAERNQQQAAAGQQFAAKMLTLMEQLHTVADGAAGYKRRLVAAGMSEQAAEVMAVQLHEAMMNMLNAQFTAAAAAGRTAGTAGTAAASPAHGGAAHMSQEWLRGMGLDGGRP